MKRRLLLERTIRLSDEIAVPELPAEALWLKADAEPNNLGRLRALLYKPAAISIATKDDQGRESTWRLLPRVARTGFILFPTLTTGKDLVALTQGEALSHLKSFRFDAPEGQREFWSHVDVQLFGLPELPLSALPMSWLIELGIFDRRAVSMKSAEQMQIIDIPEGRALLLHAAGEVVFAVPRGATHFAGSFGLRPGAYSEGGLTDGVQFEVDAVWPSGRKEKIWDRYLDPVARAQDRGSQRFDVPLPADAPSGLVLRTGPGPNNDNRWDWSYVANLRFDAAEAQ